MENDNESDKNPETSGENDAADMDKENEDSGAIHRDIIVQDNYLRSLSMASADGDHAQEFGDESIFKSSDTPTGTKNPLKFEVSPVLERLQSPEMYEVTDDDFDWMEETSEECNDSAQSTIASLTPIRTYLARRAMSLSPSLKSSPSLNSVAEIPFGSMSNIHQSLQDVKRAQYSGTALPDKRTLRRNILFQCLSFFFCFTAFVPIRSLQTSLNHEQNLGTIAVSVTYVGCILGSLICPFIIARIGAKRTMCLSSVTFIFYIAGNFYPSFYTLMPTSFVVGLGFSCLMGASGAYQSNVAAAYAAVTRTTIEKVMPFFGGLHFTFIQSANIAGNALSSTILKLLGPVIDPDHYTHLAVNNETNVYDIDYNETESLVCGAEFCNVFTTATKFHVSFKAYYLLLSTLFVFVGVSLLICIFCVARLENIFVKRDTSVKTFVKDLLTFHKEWKMWFLLPSATYAAFGPAFMYGDITKAFVTCPIGLDMIGYALVCYAVTSGLISFSSGYIVRLIGSQMLLYIGSLCLVALHVVMLLWIPQRDSTYVIFALFVCLGVTYSIYQTSYYSLVGVLFKGRTEIAFPFVLIYQSIVTVLAFGLAPSMCMREKLSLALAYTVLTIFTYTILRLLMRREKKRNKERTESERKLMSEKNAA